VQLFRGWNAIPSLCLVLLGAWTGAGKTLLALKHLTGEESSTPGRPPHPATAQHAAALPQASRLVCPPALCTSLATPLPPYFKYPACHAPPIAAVWFMGLASASVALASCAINDYFDWRIDAVGSGSCCFLGGSVR
jgi:hypothetical protein